MTTSSNETDTPLADLPAPLLAFAEQNIGQVHRVTDCSGPRENSHVWRLTAGQRERTWYLKQHPSVALHAREVHAFAQWAAALGPAGAPHLHAASPDLRAIIISSVAGAVVGGELPTEDEVEVHRQLGGLLRVLHATAPAGPLATASPSLGSLEGKLDRARSHLGRGDEELIRMLAGRLVTLGALPHVPTHGDLQLRNALWDDQRRQLALIDFERAEYAPAVRDLLRLEYGPWDGRPDLRSAFTNGYGRALTVLEAEIMPSMAALDALSAIAWGTGAGDRDAVGGARRTLARLHHDAGL